MTTVGTATGKTWRAARAPAGLVGLGSAPQWHAATRTWYARRGAEIVGYGDACCSSCAKGGPCEGCSGATADAAGKPGRSGTPGVGGEPGVGDPLAGGARAGLAATSDSTGPSDYTKPILITAVVLGGGILVWAVISKVV